MLRSLLFTLTLLAVNFLNAQQFHANVISIDSCANYLVVNQNIPTDFIASGTFFYLNQHRGAQIQTGNNDNFGTLTNLNGTGRYEINRVATVIGDTIFATFKLRHDYLTTDNATAITMSPVQNGPIANDQLATPYDGNTGGVLLIGSDQALEISANLNADAMGHTGGQSEVRNSQCGAFTSANNYSYDATNWRGAYKGQGAALPSLIAGRETGRGPNLNGGGGGNDHNSGGGGGSNITPGGNGAANREPGLFNCKGNFPGLGGRPLPNIEDNVQRVYLGGGGGAGHGNNPNPTAGGNGGGIIVVVAPEIIFTNSPTLSVRGGDAELVDGDGGGGGGAGGSILLLTEQVSGPSTIDISGGNGGDVTNNNQNRCFGPGGGGSGGRLLYAGQPTGEFTLNVNGGQGGESLNSQVCNPGENVASNGSLGITEDAIQQPQTVQEALNYPDQAIITAPQCIGSQLSIGLPNDQSCFAARWFIATPNAYTDLQDNPDHSNNNTPALDILNLPIPAIGDTVEYMLVRYGRNGEQIAVLNVKVPTIADVMAGFTSVSDQLSVNFTNTSIGANSQQWFFGDGTSSSVSNPMHTYASSGNYMVTLIVNGNCGTDTIVNVVSVMASAPTAVIGGMQNEICLGDTLKFFSLSENASSIEWSGDQLSFLPSNSSDTVCVVPANPGTYNVTLCANNLDQQQCVTQTINIVSPPNYAIESNVDGNNFSATATGNGATDLIWVLPSGDTLRGNNISTEFPGAGTYMINFVAQNEQCPAQQESITVVIEEPTVPQIRTTMTQGCSPFSVFFYNISLGPVDSILWTNEVAMPFNSQSDTLLLSFQDPGIFTVSLTVFSPNGTFTETTDIEVFASPEVNFNINEVDGLLTTTNLSSGANSYQWNFGDGNSSNAFEPTHQYTAVGSYEVTLNAFNEACNRASSRSVFVDMVNSTIALEALGIAVYPNPVGELLHIEGEIDAYSLYSPQGKLLQTATEIHTQNQRIELDQYPAGLYLLRIQRGKKSVSLPLIKQ